MQRQIVSQGILKFKKREVKNDDLKMNSRLPCCMRVENVELAVWARDRQERDSKNHKVLLLTKNSYLINNRGGLRGQGRGLAY